MQSLQVIFQKNIIFVNSMASKDFLRLGYTGRKMVNEITTGSMISIDVLDIPTVADLTLENGSESNVVFRSTDRLIYYHDGYQWNPIVSIGNIQNGAGGQANLFTYAGNAAVIKSLSGSNGIVVGGNATVADISLTRALTTPSNSGANLIISGNPSAGEYSIRGFFGDGQMDAQVIGNSIYIINNKKFITSAGPGANLVALGSSVSDYVVKTIEHDANIFNATLDPLNLHVTLAADFFSTFSIDAVYTIYDAPTNNVVSAPADVSVNAVTVGGALQFYKMGSHIILKPAIFEWVKTGLGSSTQYVVVQPSPPTGVPQAYGPKTQVSPPSTNTFINSQQCVFFPGYYKDGAVFPTVCAVTHLPATQFYLVMGVNPNITNVTGLAASIGIESCVVSYISYTA